MQTSRSTPSRNPFEAAVSKPPEIPVTQRVEAALAKFQTAESSLPREDALALVSRVFEHSSEDGMKMAERLKLTPNELFDACARGPYALKHPKIFDQLLVFVRRNKKDLPGELKRLEQAEKTAAEPGKAQALKLATPQAKILYADIDAAYADLLKERKIKAKDVGESGKKSSEELAENFLARIDLALQGGYYAGPVQGALEKKLDAKQL